MSKIEMAGKRFGRLLVLTEANQRANSGESQWICQCDCGAITKPIRGSHLRNGKVLSCGCYHKELVTQRGHLYPPKYVVKHGKSRSRLYRIWRAMKRRCLSPKSNRYAYYGGRGITVCDDWKNNFISFYKWAIANGYQDDLTIDRIDNNKGYFPDNCRWATIAQQNANRRIGKGKS